MTSQQPAQYAKVRWQRGICIAAWLAGGKKMDDTSAISAVTGKPQKEVKEQEILYEKHIKQILDLIRCVEPVIEKQKNPLAIKLTILTQIYVILEIEPKQALLLAVRYEGVLQQTLKELDLIKKFKKQ